MNTKGAGLTYINDYHSDEMRVFKAGLKNYPKYSNVGLVKGTTNTIRNYHDKINYERGIIQHSRSNANQFINFHYMYGGFNTYVLQRYFYQVWYKRNIRNFWLPVLLGYTFGSITMRMYDNASHDYFYFSD